MKFDLYMLPLITFCICLVCVAVYRSTWPKENKKTMMVLCSADRQLEHQNWICDVTRLEPHFINEIKVMVYIVLNLSCEENISCKWPCDLWNEIKVIHVLCKSGLSLKQPACATSRARFIQFSSYQVNNKNFVSGQVTLEMGSRSLIYYQRLALIKDS